MQATVNISSTKKTSHEGAVISINSKGKSISELYIDFTTLLRHVPKPTETSLDLLVTAATVYALDRLAPRKDAENGWERTFEVSVPVKNANKWLQAADSIDRCISFLSGDSWHLTFTERTQSLIRRRQRQRRSRTPQRVARGDVAGLFSGGLDSLVGTINWLESTADEKISLVGHHDPQIGGVKSDQKKVNRILERAYPGRFRTVLVGVGHSKRGKEPSMRSRSLLFVALGVVVADYLGKGIPLMIPENGTIALNVPLTPSRRGSCSTRTAHPFYLKSLQEWMNGIGLQHSIENPLIGMSKGQVVSQCANIDVLRKSALLSNSCAKRGRKGWWKRRTAHACGACMPCIYRRAALNTIGMDTEVYGNDICMEEIDITNSGIDSANDFRACLTFLKRDLSRETIASMLLATGPLPYSDVLQHADTVTRAMKEIRTLLRDKATPEIQRLAGLKVKSRNVN